MTSGGLDDECVSHVSCGARHTLAVTEDGEVFSWGLGHFGVLGRSFTPYDYNPEAALAGFDGDGDNAELVTAIDRERSVEGAQNGRLQSNPYCFDTMMVQIDQMANLSLTDSSDQCIPKVIDSLEGIKIVGVSAGHRHSLLLDERGWLYSCGAGITGCLGHGDNSSSKIPMRIKTFGKFFLFCDSFSLSMIIVPSLLTNQLLLLVRKTMIMSRLCR